MNHLTPSPYAGFYIPLTAEQTDAYLARLGCERKPEPTLAYLAELMKAQLLNVPFEDLEVFHEGTAPSLNTADMFDKIVTRRRGGYCFELNGLFQKLLESLGYRCRNVIGRIALGRGHLTPPAHRVMLIELDGVTLFCDVGFGGPVPLSPIRLTENEILTCAAGRRYRFERGERETAILLERDGAFTPMILFSEIPCDLIDYIPLNAFCAYDPDQPFSQRQMVSRWSPDGKCSISGDLLTVEKNGTAAETRLDTEESLRTALKEHFGIVYNGALRDWREQ